MESIAEKMKRIQGTKLPVDKVKPKLKELGLIGEDGKVISLSKFKQVADAHPYGRGKNKLYIVYVFKHSRESIFAFYPPQGTKKECLGWAYEYLVDTVESEYMCEWMDGNVMWGNCGIPIGYGNIRANYIEE